MAPKLPRVLWTDVFKALERAGFRQIRGGPHQNMNHPDGRAVKLSFRIGLSEVNPVYLKAVLKQAGISVEEFISFLELGKTTNL